MNLFDCHNHIQDMRLFPQFNAVMDRARMAGVVRMGVKGCCEADWPRVAEIAESYDGIYPSFGLHPWFIADRSEGWLLELEGWLHRYPTAGVGEIGIDHKVMGYDAEDQDRVFIGQLNLARRLKRPVTIHCRNAWGVLIKLLDFVGPLPRGMLIHCFGGSSEVAQELVRRGAYISFSGSITRPNNRKAGRAIRAVPEDRILIETDAPDLMPSTAIGDLNEPANVRLVLEKAAELRGISETELARLTFQNAARFYSLKG
ncbi:MAG: TatD family hydrolase [Pontiellaceae bacterium]|nr:TatD family hydrolase [Pontiellaceae bacterium]MBN2785695.1 TatD family hydrolase [Pontiellaceae bacterium]